ncbi:MAG: nucleotide sugar dehydrogenase, partial [Gemmobacter sp.]|nr:nucleotide sugar dehydrogenase [Gemmobacter sp.]
RISFMNELAQLAEKLGVDIEQVRTGIGTDPRIGTHFLYAGTGYGGSCFPKDVNALLRTAEDAGHPLRVLKGVQTVNDLQKSVLVDKVVRRFGNALGGKRFAIWGLAFKPGTDDMREAPSLTINPALVGSGAKVRVVDPQGRKEGEALLPGVKWADDAYHAAQGAHAVVILTEWNEFRALDLKKLARKMETPRMADLRNIYAAKDVKKAGFEAHIGVGR